MKTMLRQQVVWTNVNRNLEVQRFLKLIMSWQRKPRTERRRCSGTDRLDRHHWRVKNIAEHTSRVQFGVMLATLGEVGVVGVDCGYWSNRSTENAGEVVEAEDDDGDPPGAVRTSSPVLCG